MYKPREENVCSPKFPPTTIFGKSILPSSPIDRPIAMASSLTLLHSPCLNYIATRRPPIVKNWERAILYWYISTRFHSNVPRSGRNVAHTTINKTTATMKSYTVTPMESSTRSTKDSLPKKKYHHCEPAEMAKHVIQLFESGLSFDKYSEVVECNIPRETIRRYFAATGLAKLAKKLPKGKPRTMNDEKKKEVIQHCSSVAFNRKSSLTKAGAAKRYLTDNEELQVVQIARCLSAIGHGISRLELLSLVNDLIRQKTCVGDPILATDKYVRALLKRHDALVRICSSSSMDPQRAKQATESTRDSFFVKLDNHVKMLNEMGKVPWSNFCDMPAENLFNMDEVGTDTTKHRSKLIADATLLRCVFQLTPEGDGKMSMHITACITTCGNGRYCIPKDGISGAPAPLLIFTDKSKSKEKEREVREQQRHGALPNEQQPSARFLVGLGSNEDESFMNQKDSEMNPFGFRVATTSTEVLSMIQETFFAFATHFIENLGPGLGPNGMPVFLFLDEHGSWWHTLSLSLLIRNNIHPIFIPSHTSIWAQPNDCGVNH